MLARAYGEVVRSTVAIVAEMTGQVDVLADELEARFEEHPDAEILRSLPGLGSVLGARVLAEFGDDPTRYADPKARKNYAGTSPITKASGRSKVALARFARNRRLGDAVGVLLADHLSRGSPLLRRPPRQGRDPPTGATVPRQPLGGDPPWLLGAPAARLGADRLAHDRTGGRLTASARGMSSCHIVRGIKRHLNEDGS